MLSDGNSKLSFIIVKSNEEIIYASKGKNMKQEPTPKTISEAEELSPAAREFARTIAAALVKRWHQEHQAKEPDCGGVSHPNYPPHRQ